MAKDDECDDENMIRWGQQSAWETRVATGLQNMVWFDQKESDGINQLKR